MKVEINEVTIKKAKIYADAEVFIVPNNSILPEPKYIMDQYKYIIDHARTVMDANNMEYNYNTDRLVEFWWSSEDLKSENIGDHGFRFIDENGCNMYVRCCYSSIVNILPRKLFDGMTEGSTRQIVIPLNNIKVSNNRKNDEERYDIELVLNVTAAQTKYRYSRFGNFEDVLTVV